MNDGNSPPPVHARMKYWRTWEKSNAMITAYAAIQARKYAATAIPNATSRVLFTNGNLVTFKSSFTKNPVVRGIDSSRLRFKNFWRQISRRFVANEVRWTMAPSVTNSRPDLRISIRVGVHRTGRVHNRMHRFPKLL